MQEQQHKNYMLVPYISAFKYNTPCYIMIMVLPTDLETIVYYPVSEKMDCIGGIL